MFKVARACPCFLKIKPVNPKGNRSLIVIGRTGTETEAPMFLPLDVKNWLIRIRPSCCERLKAGEGDDRRWDGWKASATWWTWVWASSRGWWWTGKPGVLQSMGSQRVGHDWVPELDLNWHGKLEGERELLKTFLLCKEIKPVNPEEISPEYSLEGLMLMLKLQYFGHLMQRANSLEKTLMLGKIEDRGKGTTEDEMVGWNHRLIGHEFGQTPRGSGGQGSLLCCSPWGLKELDTA